MSHIDHIVEIWDNGVVSPASMRGTEVDRFKRQTGANRVVATQWRYAGRQYQTAFYVRLLKDWSGFVHHDQGDLRTGRLVVLNGDCSQRTVITVPRIDGSSRPEDGYLNLPPSSACFGDIDWGCEGNDGHTDYLFDFDWNTGKLLRYARPTRPW